MSAMLVAIKKKKGMMQRVTGAGSVVKTIKELVEKRRVATEEIMAPPPHGGGIGWLRSHAESLLFGMTTTFAFHRMQ